MTPLTETPIIETRFAGTVRTAAALVHSFLFVLSNGVSFGNGPVPAVVRV